MLYPFTSALYIKFIVTMNTQLHSAIKATPYEVVFGIKAALEPIPSLRVIDEPSTNDDTDLTDSGEVPEGELRKYMHG